MILPGVDPSLLWDPVFILSQITSSTPPLGLDKPLIENSVVRFMVSVVSLLGIGIAQISVNIAANVVSASNDFSNLAPHLISFKTGGLLTGLMGIFIMPWKLLSSADTYIFEWLVGYSALIGPIAGVMITDYWLLKKQELHIVDLYKTDGRYAPFQPGTVIALACGILPNIPGFIRNATGLAT